MIGERKPPRMPFSCHQVAPFPRARLAVQVHGSPSCGNSPDQMCPLSPTHTWFSGWSMDSPHPTPPHTHAPALAVVQGGAESSRHFSLTLLASTRLPARRVRGTQGHPQGTPWSYRRQGWVSPLEMERRGEVCQSPTYILVQLCSPPPGADPG